MHAIRWTFRDAANAARRRLAKTHLEPALLPTVQRLFSALLFVDPALRPSPATVEAGRPCKARLWGRGISGDDPILLVRVDDAEAALVREAVAAQRYLRTSGARFDLVFLDLKPSGYVDPGAAGLRQVLSRGGAADWMERRGGVYVLSADQLAADERLLLEASARVVLDTSDGSMLVCLSKTHAPPPVLPRLDPTSAPDPAPRPVVAPTLLFPNEHGGFSENGSEYVITVRPSRRLPAPWCNVLANASFGALVSESSLGCTWSENSSENRLTPWRNDPLTDAPSEALYLRDEESTAVWSPTPLPAGDEAEVLVRHGAGYTTWTKESHGLRQELTVFVPPDMSAKVVRLRLENTRRTHRRLTATYYAEWVLGSQREEQRAYVTTERAPDAACFFARCSWNADFGERVAFLASDRPLHGFTTDREEFLGQRGDYGAPEALERWGLSGRVDGSRDPCVAIQVHLELAPNASLEAHFFLGQGADRASAEALVAKLSEEGAAATSWRALGEFWDQLLGAVRVKTPEPAMDVMCNRWLLYQTVSSRIFGRTAFYQSSGAVGFRDQLQDAMALIAGAPQRTRAQIVEAAAHQFEEGDVLHWWHPPVGRGVRTRCSDDMAWLPFVTCEYVQATGDISVLDEQVPFLAGAPLGDDEHDHYGVFETTATRGSLFEHCRRALDRAATSGPHGLPLMGGGDWNDGMNRVGAKGRGESVWLGWFLVAAMNRFAALCDLRGGGGDADAWRARSRTLHQAIEACAWDGAWYVRAFHDDGSIVGSSRNRECRIDSIAQSWAALSGGGDEARACMAVRSAGERLVRDAERLVLLLEPPFDSTRHDPGYIRAYPPGVRENGGQYTHAAAWLGMAHVSLGDGDGAARIFRLLNPALRGDSREACALYRLEPYVLAGDIYGAAPFVGRGGWSWYTGSAAWTWRLGVEHILGLRREHGHLKVDPCVPTNWKGFEAWITLAERVIHVTVENPDGVSTGITSMTIDGIATDGNTVRLDPQALGGTTEIEVRIRLGVARTVSRGAKGELSASRPQASAR
jgi:cyclic beta-1,2-glucan synthetase